MSITPKVHCLDISHDGTTGKAVCKDLIDQASQTGLMEQGRNKISHLEQKMLSFTVIGDTTEWMQ